ncbi:hypothetical protein LEP1GSC082_0165 [Leptospira kirschneri str. H2]|uniref:Uncharacterized protein n=2 Tax=Leptospira kirschneri TaxID=29507 RepID=A0A0E2B0Q1_9LEPT|nr:hypothetical protein LEP1GSC081_1856 [Leptospira kirschneri str. H1]EKO58816.1 hypothetical protein LEP1GSC082_0165 [Leptospira kirschneri str. H2]EMK20063.1 hypothetical protein LEP1GSC008_3014 [Leptospira kirschneri serovar Bulgarica str. Nikolaevo]
MFSVLKKSVESDFNIFPFSSENVGTLTILDFARNTVVCNSSYILGIDLQSPDSNFFQK